MAIRNRREYIQAKGMFSFVVKYGVLGFGVVTATIFSVILINSTDTSNVNFLWFQQLGDSGVLTCSFVAFPIGGIVLSSLMWHFFLKVNGKKNHIILDT